VQRSSTRMTDDARLVVVDVRELTEGAPVELSMSAAGEVVVRAYNECRNDYTEVDLLALLNWSRFRGKELVGAFPAVSTSE
jgi:hypothetical protein